MSLLFIFFVHFTLSFPQTALSKNSTFLPLPKKCAIGEEFSNCGLCEQTCGFPKIPCPLDRECLRRGCQCKSGFQRKGTNGIRSGPCVPVDQCRNNFCFEGCAKYFDGCNECVCTENGSPLCTSKVCKRKTDPYCIACKENKSCKTKKKCSHNCLSWDDGCNVCHCDKNGFAVACTERACFQQGQPKCLKCQPSKICDLSQDPWTEYISASNKWHDLGAKKYHFVLKRRKKHFTFSKCSQSKMIVFVEKDVVVSVEFFNPKDKKKCSRRQLSWVLDPYGYETIDAMLWNVEMLIEYNSLSQIKYHPSRGYPTLIKSHSHWSFFPSEETHQISCLSVDKHNDKKCRPPKKAAAKCPFGLKPLKVSNSTVDVYCGRGGVRCPSGYTCHIHPTDVFAVCCPSLQKVKYNEMCSQGGCKMLFDGCRNCFCGKNGSAFCKPKVCVRSGIPRCETCNKVSSKLKPFRECPYCKNGRKFVKCKPFCGYRVCGQPEPAVVLCRKIEPEECRSNWKNFCVCEAPLYWDAQKNDCVEKKNCSSQVPPKKLTITGSKP